MARFLDRLTDQNSSGILFRRLWDKVCTKIEGAFTSLSDQLALIAAAATTANWSGVANDNGHKAADDATVGAAWGTNLTGRPTELTDGRVSAGLNASGDLNRDLTTTRANSSNLLRKTSGGLFTGDLNATNGATLGTNVSGQISSSNVSALVAASTVDTAYIVNNAVTNPTSAYTAGSVTVPNTSTWTDIQSVTMTATGAVISIQGFFYAGYFDATSASIGAGLMQYRLLRDVTVIFGPVDFGLSESGSALRGTGSNSCLILDQPAAGSHTYKLQAISTNAGDSCVPLARSLVVLEVKK